MMRPKMEQLLDYVRGGEEDPNIADMLKFDPDGDAKLREARFICGMLGMQSTQEPDQWAGMQSEDLAPMPDMEVAALRETERRPSIRASLSIVEPPDGRDQIPDVIHNAESSSSPGTDLGTMIATEDDTAYTLSYRPPTSSEDNENLEPAVSDGQICVEWSDFRIWFSQSSVADRPFKVLVTGPNDDSPVGGIDVVFMAASGPFRRIQTNDRGATELVPIQDGVLRFSGRDIGLLRIERKNRPDS